VKPTKETTSLVQAVKEHEHHESLKAVVVDASPKDSTSTNTAAVVVEEGKTELSDEDQAASDRKSLVIAVLTLVFSVPALVGS